MQHWRRHAQGGRPAAQPSILKERREVLTASACAHSRPVHAASVCCHTADMLTHCQHVEYSRAGCCCTRVNSCCQVYVCSPLQSSCERLYPHSLCAWRMLLPPGCQAASRLRGRSSRQPVTGNTSCGAQHCSPASLTLAPQHAGYSTMLCTQHLVYLWLLAPLLCMPGHSCLTQQPAPHMPRTPAPQRPCRALPATQPTPDCTCCLHQQPRHRLCRCDARQQGCRCAAACLRLPVVHAPAPAASGRALPHHEGPCPPTCALTTDPASRHCPLRLRCGRGCRCAGGCGSCCGSCCCCVGAARARAPDRARTRAGRRAQQDARVRAHKQGVRLSEEV